MRLGLGIRLGPIGGFAMPSGLSWDSSYPVTVQRSGTGYTVVEQPRSYIPPEVFSGTTFYVDIATGSDADSGLTEALAKKCIYLAIAAGNATGAPFQVMVKGGSYNRDFNFNASGGGTVPTQHCAVIGYGGRVITGSYSETHTWAADATFTNTYSATRSACTRLFDRLNLDAFGNYAELTQVADAATCNTTPGSWAQVGSIVYARRLDGAPVTHANTRTLLTGEACLLGTKTIYLEGIDFEGGNIVGCMNATQTATRNIVAVGCTFKYAGSATTPSNDGVAVNNMTGLAAFFNCEADANSKDGFNSHANTGTHNFLTVNCRGEDNGRYASTSCNGFTVHEATSAIDVGGYYGGNRNGSDFHNINTSKCWAIGTEVVQSAAGYASNLANACFTVGDTAIIWAENTRATAQSGARALQAVNGTIRKRNHTTVAGAEVATGTGAIDSF
ncbi:hypothetical protein SH584_11455 [Sphingomonas sp. LY29]|uniref:hypothetical protein n=1 Tax=Sphingomonas sp. LY29 TaxID=3095341 RepID=UPI002D773B04|nr:hypothetical protein [Sphingomonas sp. LY29]WRP25648.1 hypothetical protein SH584_11455 [Sphingomonas sp. LY29]